MDPTEKLPGLTFHVDYAALQHKVGQVRLGASVEDPDLWDRVVKILDGYRVYTVQDLQGALIDVLRQDGEETKTRHAREVEALRAELERAQQEVSVLRSCVAAYRKLETAFLRAAEELTPVSPMVVVDYPYGLQRDRAPRAGDVRLPEGGRGSRDE